jgi:serine/threonine protein kinase
VEAATIIHNLFLAVNHCHALGVIHRDIKLDNIMVTKNNEIRLIDFGLSKMQQISMKKMNTFAGTPIYMAPEIYDKSYTYKVDFWAIGVVLVLLVSGT